MMRVWFPAVFPDLSIPREAAGGPILGLRALRQNDHEDTEIEALRFLFEARGLKTHRGPFEEHEATSLLPAFGEWNPEIAARFADAHVQSDFAEICDKQYASSAQSTDYLTTGWLVEDGRVILGRLCVATAEQGWLCLGAAANAHDLTPMLRMRFGETAHLAAQVWRKHREGMSMVASTPFVARASIFRDEKGYVRHQSFSGFHLGIAPGWNELDGLEAP